MEEKETKLEDAKIMYRRCINFDITSRSISRLHDYTNLLHEQTKKFRNASVRTVVEGNGKIKRSKEYNPDTYVWINTIEYEPRTKDDRIEALAKFQHNLWLEWSANLAENENISKERLERWKTYWIPYAELPEEAKEQARTLAKNMIQTMENPNEVLTNNEDQKR